MTRTIANITAAIALMSQLVCGCASRPREQIPTYAVMDVARSLGIVRERAARLERLTAKGSITLSNPQQGSVRLDAVFVLAPPDRARIRAWKFNQAVFDLTANSDGVFVYAPRDQSAPGQISEASRGVGAAVRQWLTYLRGTLDTQGATLSSDKHQIRISRPQEAAGTLTTVIDRATLTVRSHRLVDAAGAEQFVLSLSHYRQFDDAVWPCRIKARSASGTIIIETRELDPHIAADAAFKPPARAIRLQ